MTFGATLSGIRPAIQSNVFFVARWVSDLSLISSCHREKVRFSAAFRKSSSHPSVVMLSSFEESAAKLLLDCKEESGVVRSPLPLRAMSTMMLLLSITVVVDEGGGRRAALAKSEDSERFLI